MNRILSHRSMGAWVVFAALAALIGAAPMVSAARNARAAAKPADTSVSFNKTIGSKSAPITIEIFGDFQCPACRAQFEDTTKMLIDTYVSDGKVLLVHRDFPLPLHAYAMQAARLANAAAANGMFEAFERALYDHQDQWSPTGNIEQTIAPLFSPAQMKTVHDFEMTHMAQIDASIQNDKMMGQQRGVNQTPTIYVTSRGKTEALPGGVVAYPLMKQYLDYLLRQQ